MATYKAEFMSHYYKGRLRPRAAYSMGLIFWWAELASHAPSVANFIGQTPILRNFARLAGGIAQQRALPLFAPQTFKQWFKSRPTLNRGLRQVIFWPDTFNNYFHPETAKAAVEILEQADYQVLVPQPALCCGRPLYDFGMLDLARYKLRQILTALQPQISADIPMVGLEPSCVSVFRDEMKSLFSHDADAQRLSRKTFTLSEFLVNEAGYEPPQLSGKALIHGHCHDKSILGFQTEVDLLKRMGVRTEAPDSGCCGMAGSFGFEPGDKYDVSMKCGERALLPEVRHAEQQTLIVADGFSCRTQIEQTTNRRTLHLAQVIQMALAEDQRRAEGRSRVPASMPSHEHVAATTNGAGMILPDEHQDGHNRSFGSVALTAGSVAGGLLLAYVGGRYLSSRYMGGHYLSHR